MNSLHLGGKDSSLSRSEIAKTYPVFPLISRYPLKAQKMALPSQTGTVFTLARGKKRVFVLCGPPQHATSDLFVQISTLAGHIDASLMFEVRGNSNEAQQPLPQQQQQLPTATQLSVISGASEPFLTDDCVYDALAEDIRQEATLRCNFYEAGVKYFEFEAYRRACSLFVQVLPRTRFPADKMTIRIQAGMHCEGRYVLVLHNASTFWGRKHKTVNLAWQWSVPHSPSGWLRLQRLGDRIGCCGYRAKRHWFWTEITQETADDSRRVLCLSRDFYCKGETQKISLSGASFTVANEEQHSQIVIQLADHFLRLKLERVADLRIWFEHLTSDCDPLEEASKLGRSPPPEHVVEIDEDQASFYDSTGPSFEEESGGDSATLPIGAIQVSRSELPAAMVPLDVKFSDLLFSKGKSLPICLNEPLTLLQRVCEDLEYSEALVASLEESQDFRSEFLAVLGFSLSSYCSGTSRFRRKPFNPMLGETFEWQNPTGEIRFFAEKVSHDPLIVAGDAQIGTLGHYWASLQIQSTFRGFASAAVHLAGWHYFHCRRSNRVYRWRKANTLIKGLLQEKTVFIEGAHQFECVTKQITATVKFKSSDSTVQGTVPWNEAETWSIQGSWNKAISVGAEDGGERKSIFSASELPDNHHQNYGLTSFALNLNLPNPAAPPSDSRNRPDLRLYELGMVEEAQKVKTEMEAAQRQRKRSPTYPKHQARYFHVDPAPSQPEPAAWVANGSSPDSSSPTYWQFAQSGRTHPPFPWT